MSHFSVTSKPGVAGGVLQTKLWSIKWLTDSVLIFPHFFYKLLYALKGKSYEGENLSSCYHQLVNPESQTIRKKISLAQKLLKEVEF